MTIRIPGHRRTRHARSSCWVHFLPEERVGQIAADQLVHRIPKCLFLPVGVSPLGEVRTLRGRAQELWIEHLSEVTSGFASPQAQPNCLSGILSRCSHPGLLARVPEKIYPAGQWPRNHHFVGNSGMDGNGVGSLCQALIACRQVHKEDVSLENVQHSPAAGSQGVLSLQGVGNGVLSEVEAAAGWNQSGRYAVSYHVAPHIRRTAKVAVSKGETIFSPASTACGAVK